MPYPTKLGQPCWDADQVSKVIAITAHMSDQAVAYFRAAHSPFKYLVNFRTQTGTLGEEEVFQSIFAEESREVQTAIKGEPGTGKSHLIHWLKLRADYEAQRGDSRFKKLVRVLVRRGNGSFKDALRQIVEQLGPAFQDRVVRVQGAIDRMSSEAARATLIAALEREVEQHWAERGRGPLATEMKLLGQWLRAEPIRRFFSRDQGTIHQVIARLTEESSPEERENVVLFTEEEVREAIQTRTPKTLGEVVFNFCEDLYEEPKTVKLLVSTLNQALPDAVRELTGLNGSALRDIFDEIRRDLRKQKKDLALFIEDVSVAASGLDRDVINALEPHDDKDLCKMVAVLGITTKAWGLLEGSQGQIQRFSDVYEVGASVTAKWSNDEQEIAAFTARYLNAIRLNDKTIQKVAEERLEGDLRWSQCDECPIKRECFTAFGSVKLSEGAEIGMFPLTPRAPKTLLANFKIGTGITGVARSQRGLLENVLLPILKNSHSTFAHHQFPRPNTMPLETVTMREWDTFEHSRLGGWNLDDKERVKVLAQFWIEPGTAEELASRLAPLREPLGFPAFSGGPIKPPPKRKTEEKPTGGGDLSKQENDPVLDRLIRAIDDWSQGNTLNRDAEFRELLKNLIVNSIEWQCERSVPFSHFDRHVNSKAFPRIKGQLSQDATSSFFFDLPRNDETKQLLNALVFFLQEGPRSSWAYPGGELHKRIVSRWLRKHRRDIVASVEPQQPVSAQLGLRVAVHALSIAAMMRDRKSLPSDSVDRLACVLSPCWAEDDCPEVLSRELREVRNHLGQRHEKLISFIVSELGAAQGRTAPKSFLDPRPVLGVLADAKLARLEQIPEEFFLGGWQSRFMALSGLTSFKDLSQRIDAERARLSERIEEVCLRLTDCGCDTGDSRAGLLEWMKQFSEVIQLQRGRGIRDAILPLPNPAFDDLWDGKGRWSGKKFTERMESWATALRKSQETVANPDDVELLELDKKPITDLSEALTTAITHIGKVEKELAQQMDGLIAAGVGSCEALLQELSSFPLSTNPEELSSRENESER